MERTFNRLVSRRSVLGGSIGASMAAVALALPARCRGHVYPGTSLQGIDLSGMSRANAETVLRAAFGPWEARAVRFTFEGQRWDASLADLGMRVDYARMADEALARGRDGSIVDRYASLLGEGPEQQPGLAIAQRPEILEAYLRTIGAKIEQEPRDARLVHNRDAVMIREDDRGRRLDIAQAQADTLAAIETGRYSTVPLATTVVEPAISAAALADARDDALGLIDEPILFTHGEETYPIDTETLADALAIDPSGKATLRASRITARLDAIEQAVYRPARNAMLGWDGGLYVVEDDVDGVALDREALAGMLTGTARSATRTAPLPVTAVPAAARTDNVDDLGIEGHIAYGSSSFAGSSETRATNVVVAANNISFKLVGPGESFSFNELLGPITIDNGYVAGSIILGDWTATDIGGGVCQVSTTVFRAALQAGVRFNEWNAHSWRLGLYETDGSAPGMDAAIYQPNTPDELEKDLTFANPFDSWLLLMMVVDGDTVYAHLYGKDPGWTVEVFEARIGPAKPVGQPVERLNPALAPGERRLVQNAIAGSEVRVRRRVTDRDGGVISDGDFVSDYRSQPEACEVGPA